MKSADLGLGTLTHRTQRNYLHIAATIRDAEQFFAGSATSDAMPILQTSSGA
jgi:hypothetical protein